MGIKPCLSIYFSQKTEQREEFKLTALQRKETKVGALSIRAPVIYLLTKTQLFSDRFVVTDRTVGDGAHSIVYLALDKFTKRQLVCKVKNLDRIRREGGRSEVKRLSQEVDILRQLDHVSLTNWPRGTFPADFG